MDTLRINANFAVAYRASTAHPMESASPAQPDTHLMRIMVESRSAVRQGQSGMSGDTVTRIKQIVQR